MTEWNWDKFPFRMDPLTNKKICFDCWHNNHRVSGNKPGCTNATCECLCLRRNRIRSAQRTRCSNSTRTNPTR